MRSSLFSQKKRKIRPPKKQELPEKLQNAVDTEISTGERIVVQINGGVGEALLATNRRVIFVKADWLGYAKPKVYSYRYEDIAYFQWQTRRAVDIVPYKWTGLARTTLTFIVGQDDDVVGAISLISKRIVDIRLKEKAEQLASEGRYEEAKLVMDNAIVKSDIKVDPKTKVSTVATPQISVHPKEDENEGQAEADKPRMRRKRDRKKTE